MPRARDASRKPAGASPPRSGLRSRSASTPDAAGCSGWSSAWPTVCSRRCTAARCTPTTAALLRLDAAAGSAAPDVVTFSGGVSEYIYGREARSFGDLGPGAGRSGAGARAGLGPAHRAARQGIRATVVGASQYTIQVSGSTIFVAPPDDAAAAQRAGHHAGDAAGRRDDRRRRPSPPPCARAAPARPARGRTAGGAVLPLGTARRRSGGSMPSAAAWPRGLSAVLAHGQPLMLVGDGDIGGLVGIHLHSEVRLAQPVVSIDGIMLKEFDFIDIGALLETSGAVPVVIKSLVFPVSAAAGPRCRAGRRPAAPGLSPRRHGRRSAPHADPCLAGDAPITPALAAGLAGGGRRPPHLLERAATPAHRPRWCCMGARALAARPRTTAGSTRSTGAWC